MFRIAPGCCSAPGFPHRWSMLRKSSCVTRNLCNCYTRFAQGRKDQFSADAFEEHAAVGVVSRPALARMQGEDGRVPVTMRLAMMTGWSTWQNGAPAQSIHVQPVRPLEPRQQLRFLGGKFLVAQNTLAVPKSANFSIVARMSTSIPDAAIGMTSPGGGDKPEASDLPPVEARRSPKRPAARPHRPAHAGSKTSASRHTIVAANPPI